MQENAYQLTCLSCIEYSHIHVKFIFLYTTINIMEYDRALLL